MGSGKSIIGQSLAHKLNMNHIDTDDYIEQNEGASITSIFEIKGESYFRKKERELLKSLENCTNTVISTGGGMPCFYNNMGLINDLGQSFYLKVGINTLANRLW